MLRPGFIQPRRGVRSRTALYNLIYAVLGAAYPLLRKVAPAYVTDTERLGRAMLRTARERGPSRVLEARELDRLGA